jgi:glycogen operon protein
MVDGLKTEPGNPYLFGATVNAAGCNFVIYSHHATDVTLLLFDHYSDSEPTHAIPFDRHLNKTGDVWHIFIHGIVEGQLYGYVVDGPYYPDKLGYRFNENKLLMDPYTRAVGGSDHWN